MVEIMILSILTSFHVLLVLLATVSSVVVLKGLLTRDLIEASAVRFFKYSLVASVTGLLFPFHHLTETQEASMLSVYASGAAILAWRRFQLAGVWSSVFAVCTDIVIYLNVFFAIVQSFKLIPQLKMLAPTLTESPFLVTTFATMLFFVMHGFIAVKRFHN